jgi:hypothetical protein
METQYDVVFSFAGEDREYVDRVAAVLREKGVSLFYDKFEEVDLWGKDLAVHFEFVYSRSAKYCIPFISSHYKHKAWTNHEFRNAIARAVETKEDYILPAKFDDTHMDGLRTTLAYIDLRKYSPEQFADIIIKKLEGKADASKIVTEKPDDKVANIYLAQNILFSEYGGIFGAALGVTITNLTKEYRYYAEPYFKISHGLQDKFDTFYLTGRMEHIKFPIKMEWGQPVTVNYQLKAAGIEEWKRLRSDTTLKAIVTTTIGEAFESNEVKLSDVTTYM